MIALILAAFSIGALGSFHCIGMCGPLALSLPLSGNPGSKFIGAFLYNAGRVVTYAVFGLLFGLIGQSAALFGWQQWVSILAGLVILLFILLPKNMGKKSSSIVNRFFEYLRAVLGQLFFKKTKSSLFVIGLLNGLLPCGLVYMAVAGAIATGDVLHSVVFMASFGLGTLPVMWSVAYFGNFISLSIRQKIRKMYPYMMTIMACLLIIRGLGLGIPYLSPLSPSVQGKQMVVQGCVHLP